MNLPDFHEQMARLRECFGESLYPIELTTQIWKEVQQLSCDWFRVLISGFLRGSNRPPQLSDFRHAAVIAREKKAEHEKRQFNQFNLGFSPEAEFRGRDEPSGRPGGPYRTLGSFVRRCIESEDGLKSPDLEGFVKLYGIAWVEQLHEKGKKENADK